MRNKVDVLWVGDSITQYWTSDGNAVWTEYFGKMRCRNIGIAGDTTTDVLHRLDGINIEEYDPTVTVLLIGTNDISLGQSTDKIAAQAGEIIKHMRQRVPETTIILMGVFPRDASPSNPVRNTVRELNEKLQKLADNKNVRFLNIGDKFLDKSGTLPVQFMPDGLHLSKDGYQVWASNVKPLISEIVEAAKTAN